MATQAEPDGTARPVPGIPARRLWAPEIDFGAIRTELGTPPDFSAEALAEAAAPPADHPRIDLTDVPFVTVDPPGSRDLDQALHLVPDGDGFLLRYAIADVAAFVRPGSALDRESTARGVTLYLPDGRIPLHPPVLSEGAASLLPGQVSPAVVWTIRTDADATPRDVRIERATVRSTAQLSYPEVEAGARPEALTALAAFGAVRAERVLARGGIELDVPEQDIERTDDGGWKLVLRAQAAAERHNAQVSLLTGECAAALMLDAGIGLLRTLPPAAPEDVERLRTIAPSLGVDWPADATPGRVVASVDPADPRGAAFLDLAAALLRGSGYTPFTDGAPEQAFHAGVGAPYAHVTAPLRRLADRYATEICLAIHAGTPVPEWVHAALPGLPAVMAAATRRANEFERAVVDLTEAVLLADRVGEQFDAAVVDVAGEGKSGTVALDDPPVWARCAGPGLRAGERLRVRLLDADPTTRRVRFARA
ncbi:RNB domain-containing ribonuclease [Cryptosporangium aurantiacum]|uniref:Exoribonuclease R n=1 Tax=Cryptosporangium aurantiacum TaxID=134849 RepID=A0A1M7RKZ1_9ACTN|nr:RNB domain-containing ribonuclease [Cryptosporangium aurantiacum]SHN46977.1 Exoribonuclease R [Cryptosporangium aurantiacum]